MPNADPAEQSQSADPAAQLQERVLRAMREAFGDRLPADADPLLAASRNPQFGDVQCNAAMPLAKALGAKPREIAQAIVDALDVAGLCEAPTIAGPGFINFTYTAPALEAALNAMDDAALAIRHDAAAKAETVVVDVCGVNLAKSMHVGHLRATVIGDAIARLNERAGRTVKRQNHLGDWGLPIAMVTARLIQGERDGMVDLGTLTLETLEREYRAAQAACAVGQNEWRLIQKYALGPKIEAEWEDDYQQGHAELTRAKQTLVALQSGDAEAVRVWERIADITLSECFAICARLHANITSEHNAGESTYRDELPEVVNDLVSRGVAVEDHGALIVRLEEAGIAQPCLIRKRDGGYLYATTDLAAIRRRVQDLGGDRVVYPVDARQSLHFQQVFGAAHKAGYTKTNRGGAAELVHAAFGTILGEDNRPFKTRSGDNVKLADLLDEAVARANQAVAAKSPELPEEERRSIAEAVGIGAIKYADLSNDRARDYVFSFDRMLAFEGNTGPYLQYALVRVYSIFRNAESIDAEAAKALDPHDAEPAADAPAFHIGAPEEKALALELLRYPGAIESARLNHEPHRLCQYLYDLATAYSAFFAACPVLRAETSATRRARLRLCRLTGRVLRDGLEVLGMKPLERM